MGDVILVIKVMPEDPARLGQVKQGLQELKPQRIEEEPIGFGVTALKVTVIIPDAGGHQDELEERIRHIDGVGELEVLQASRSL
jgi:elongation factor 1-beta